LTESGEFAKRIKKPGVPVIALNSSEGHSFGLYRKLWKTLQTLGPAIVHTRNLAALEAQIPARLLRGVKTVHGEHGRDMFDLHGKNRKYNLLRKLIRPLVGRYIPVSKDLRRWLQQTVGVPEDKIRQIYNGVDQELFKPRDCDRQEVAPPGFLTERSFVIGTVGRLAAVKDQSTLIRAFKTLVDKNPESGSDYRLIIVGDGPLRIQLQELISELHLEKWVWMTGDRSDIPDILNIFDLYVLTSLGEGISNTILEAMATGLPIIATDVGGNPELVEEGVNGRLIPREDPGALANCIQELNGDQERLRNMGKSSLDKVKERFNWDKAVERYLSVYDELINS
jgi:sugar transferase (PEP-CTERM/EpsH1 system associated)